MTVTLYLDVFFLVNFIMDYLLLYLTKRFLRLNLKGRKPMVWGRMAAAAGTGTIWACLVLLIPMMTGWLELVVTWILIGGVMIFLAFGKAAPVEFARRLAVFWIVSAAAGGMIGVLGDRIPPAWYLTGIRAERQWSLLTLVFFAAGIYFGGCAFIRLLQQRIWEQKNLYEVTLTYHGRTKTVMALWDTGNQLYEPYGNSPVHVITREACSQLCEKVSQVIYIPFRAVGTGYGMLPGIQVDEMAVMKEGKLVRHYKKPWLAISREPLSAGHQYEMLLHGEEQ